MSKPNYKYENLRFYIEADKLFTGSADIMVDIITHLVFGSESLSSMNKSMTLKEFEKHTKRKYRLLDKHEVDCLDCVFFEEKTTGLKPIAYSEFAAIKALSTLGRWCRINELEYFYSGDVKAGILVRWFVRWQNRCFTFIDSVNLSDAQLTEKLQKADTGAQPAYLERILRIEPIY